MAEEAEGPKTPGRESYGKIGPPKTDDLRRYIKPGLWAILGIYVLLFVLKNHEDVNIDFVLFSAAVPLIWILVGLLIVGGLLTLGGQWFLRKRRGADVEKT